MLPLANERGNVPDMPGKRDPLDFVLWQRSLPDEPSWDSPVGPGRPGLAHRVLGDGDGLPRRPASRSTAAAATSSSLTTSRSWPRSEGATGRSPWVALLDARRHAPLLGREDEQVARQPRARARPAAQRYPGGRDPPLPRLAPLPRARWISIEAGLERSADSARLRRAALRRGPGAGRVLPGRALDARPAVTHAVRPLPGRHGRGPRHAGRHGGARGAGRARAVDG